MKIIIITCVCVCVCVCFVCVCVCVCVRVCAQNPSLGISGVSALWWFNGQLSHLSKIPFESLSPLLGRPT